ncbi:hypothetical protein CFP56_011608 [Quercus suber]|uniref:Uncharacterized protein n=1 Tax=Quercus suber TaxID=58331 RepID=A0AAW0KZ16_QUESU
MPLVAVDIDLNSPQPFHIAEQMKIKAQELRNKSHKKKETGNANGEGRKEVKTWIATRKCICKTFHSFVVGKNGTTSLPLKSVTNAEQLRECLRSLKRNHQDRVGNLGGGMEFLELCGFERIEGDESLVDMEILNTAGSELKFAMTNPFFGLLSV